jgi:zinc-ribbon domain
MVYRWNVEGTALEFPTPYQVENRFLTLRGYGLLALSFLVGVVLTLVGEVEPAQAVVSLDALPEPASVWPHVVGAFWMALLGVLNLVQASRQRAQLMVPGQPASLMQEVPHEATGASPHAPWLMQAMGRGMAGAQALKGAYAGALNRLSADVAAAPSTLLGYLRLRMSHLLALLFLLAVLALLGGGLFAAGKTLAPDMVALVVGGMAALLLVRQVWQPVGPALSPLVLGSFVMVGVLVAAPLAWFGAGLPGADKWPRLGLPTAAALLLLCGLTLEFLALQAARKHIATPRPAKVAPQETTVAFDADLAQLFNEVDRELFRRWAEGIPNRRYARQPPVVDGAAEEGSFSATVLEESQPLVPPPAGAPAADPGSAGWLRTLGVLSLVLTLAGGLCWLWLAYAHMRSSAASWLPAAPGLVGLLLGGYALNLAHVLWSRMEAGSTLTWLELKGSYFRVAGATATSGGPGRRPAESSAGVDGVTLRACVVQARSVYYAAAPHGIGSRALVSLTEDTAAATGWTSVVQTLAKSAGLSPVATSPAMLAARARVRERRTGAAEAPGAPKRPARFCSACGTPLLAGARFCQHCGSTVPAE